MKRTLGPLDKRKRVTRCQACAKRRIKCEGGSPCEHCVRTNKTCQLQEPPQNEVRQLPMQVCKHSDALYLDYFAFFMQRCQFTKRFASVTTDLAPLIRASPSLRRVAIAIGALDASRRSSVRATSGQDSPRYVALSSYGRSIQALQTQLAKTVSVQCDDVLWSTFFLGLFELISESSGDGWAQHLCYGTSKVLQEWALNGSSSPLRQTLFDTFRMLEAIRAIMYGDGTLLSQDAWQSYHPNPTSKGSGSSDPMETIHGLMIQTSAFSKLFFDQLGSIPEPLKSTDPAIAALARTGMQIQQRIRTWHDDVSPNLDRTDPHDQLALANYHALELFHSRNYTFDSCWENKTAPSLTRSEIDAHVTAILHLSTRILEASVVPGVTLLFPLRMAGANALEADERAKVVDLLGRIYRSGFVVSERIKADVQELWQFLAL